MARFDLADSRRPHLIPVRLMWTPSQMRAHLMATIRPLPRHSGRLPPVLISRELIEQITGLAVRTQRKYENEFGATELVQECYALVEGYEGPPASGHGRFSDGIGRQLQRLPDLRTPTEHRLGSKSARTRANREAARLRAANLRDAEAGRSHASASSPQAAPLRPASESRRCTIFVSDSEESARRMAIEHGPLGRGASSDGRKGAVLGWEHGGRWRFAIVENQWPRVRT